MYFRQFIHEEKSCLSYMIGCRTEGTVAVIEPQADVSFYLDQAASAGLKITQVIDTHTQADHRSGAAELAHQSGAPVLMYAGALVTFPFEPLEDGVEFSNGNRRFKVIATPGHTADGISLHVDDWYLLTGDTLFVNDVGRVDLTLTELDPAGQRQNARQLYRSIQKLLALPEWTEIYPSHFGGSSCGKGLSAKMISTLGREKRRNQALQLTEDRFVKYVTEGTPAPPADFQAIKRANIAGRTASPRSRP